MTDYDGMAARYDKGRVSPRSTMDRWRIALTPYIRGLDGPLLDLGAGTGWWTLTLAEWFGIDVIGVDRSAAMLGRAVGARSDPRIMYTRARGERLPLADACCSVAWISTVIHHIDDLPMCASELHRVLVPGGRVLIRNAFTGRTGGIPWLRFFPEARAAAEARWPTVERTVGIFEAAGFTLEKLQAVVEETSPDLRAYADRIRVRADSTLAELDDSDFNAGMARLERAAAETNDAPVTTRLDLMILR